jgi:hypothetical protein
MTPHFLLAGEVARAARSADLAAEPGAGVVPLCWPTKTLPEGVATFNS